MQPTGASHLSELRRQLYLEPAKENEILEEIQTHIEDRTTELVEGGNSREEALARALDEMGTTRSIGQQLYAVYHQAPWQHTALAALPHLLLAIMFGLGLWTNQLWVVLLLVTATVISVFGWRMGRPTWTYPWLGYCLVVPIISWGLAMSAVAYGAWRIITSDSLPLSFPLYIVCLAYIALSMWAVVKIVSRLVRPEWLMASLTVLPCPFLAYWFFYFYSRAGAQEATQAIQGVDASAAAVFLILAGTTVVFFRIGRRLLKVAVLLITAPSVVVLAWLSYQGGPGVFAIFLFSAISLALLLSPALLYRQRERRAALEEDLPVDLIR